MGTDHHWVAVHDVVLKALLQDVALHSNPPTNEDEVGDVAQTVADHLVGEFTFVRRQ